MIRLTIKTEWGSVVAYVKKLDETWSWTWFPLSATIFKEDVAFWFTKVSAEVVGAKAELVDAATELHHFKLGGNRL